MKIVILDAYTSNPGDLNWDKMEALGDLTVYVIPENCVSVLSMRRRPHPAPVSVSGSRRAWCA